MNLGQLPLVLFISQLATTLKFFKDAKRPRRYAMLLAHAGAFFTISVLSVWLNPHFDDFSFCHESENRPKRPQCSVEWSVMGFREGAVARKEEKPPKRKDTWK